MRGNVDENWMQISRRSVALTTKNSLLAQVNEQKWISRDVGSWNLRALEAEVLSRSSNIDSHIWMSQMPKQT